MSTPTKKHNRCLGNYGEEAASLYLKNADYIILERNWHYGHLELDLICEKENTIIFVEVKTRVSEKYGGPQAALTRAKINNILTAARAWLALTGNWHKACRFDLICLTGRLNNYLLEHYPDAFQFQGTLDHRYANW